MPGMGPWHNACPAAVKPLSGALRGSANGTSATADDPQLLQHPQLFEVPPPAPLDAALTDWDGDAA